MNSANTTAPAAPWNAWADGPMAETIAPETAGDGRVTYAEYLERFDSRTAEYTPFANLAEWMRSVNHHAAEADRAFGFPAVYRAGGTQAFHPHTFAWVIDDLLTMAVGMGELPTGKPMRWRAYDTAAPIVRRTAEERAALEPWRAWEADGNFIHGWP